MQNFSPVVADHHNIIFFSLSTSLTLHQVRGPYIDSGIIIIERLPAHHANIIWFMAKKSFIARWAWMFLKESQRGYNGERELESLLRCTIEITGTTIAAVMPANISKIIKGR